MYAVTKEPYQERTKHIIDLGRKFGLLLGSASSIVNSFPGVPGLGSQGGVPEVGAAHPDFLKAMEQETKYYGYKGKYMCSLSTPETRDFMLDIRTSFQDVYDVDSDNEDLHAHIDVGGPFASQILGETQYLEDINLLYEHYGKEKLIILRTKDGRSFKKHIAEVRDITDGCLCAFNNSKSFGETFQLAGPKPFSWEDTIPYLSKKLNLPFVEGTPEGPPTFYEFDISKSKNILGFNPKYDIKEMIEEALKFKSGKSSNILPTD